MTHLKSPLIALFFCFNLLQFVSSGQFDYPSASKGSKWINHRSNLIHSVKFTDGTEVRAILLQGSLGPRFAAGFFCREYCNQNRYLFGVFVVITNSGSAIILPNHGFPKLVWSANRGRPVGENSTVEFRPDGNLVLTDSNGELVWSSGTAANAQSLRINSDGNLVILDQNNAAIWQSFDHPTDTLLPGQILPIGSRLISNLSRDDSSPGPYYLAMESEGLIAYAAAANPQPYWEERVPQSGEIIKTPFAAYKNGSIDVFVNSGENPSARISIPGFEANSVQFLRLEYTGRIKLYLWKNWGGSEGWISQYELTKLGFFASTTADCSLPSSCGRYGLCTEGECSCPEGFSAIDKLRPSRGCNSSASLPDCSGESDRAQIGFLDLDGVDYFANDFQSAIAGLSAEQCREKCGANCSCMAAFYRNGVKAADFSVGGLCYLVDSVFSLRNGYRGYGYTSHAYLKISTHG